MSNYTPDFDQGKSRRQIERLKVIEPNDEIAALKASVPRFANPKKTEYLVLRSVSFSHEECMRLIDASNSDYTKWLSDGDEFGIWAVGSGLLHLQQGVGEQVLKAKFLRNVFLVLSNDSRILGKKERGELKTADEMKDAREASHRYSAQNIVSMMRALDGDVGGGVDGQTPQVINIQIEVDSEVAERYGDKKILSQHLLDKFTRKTVTLDETGRVVE